MSVQKDADKALDDAKDHISKAIKSLSEIIVDQVWGYDDWTDTYTKKIQDSFYALIKTRDALNEY